MATKSSWAPGVREALSRDVIVQAATEILDAEGEDALTLRALTVRLATGYGAIYITTSRTGMTCSQRPPLTTSSPAS